MEEKKDVLKTLKALALETWNYTFWVVHRHRKAAHYEYSVKRLTTSGTLKKRLVTRIADKISWANQVYPYQEEQVENDTEEDGGGVVYSTNAAGTDLPAIIIELHQGVEAPLISKREELSGAFGYAVELTDPNDPSQSLVAFRKVAASWKLEPKGGREHVFWKNDMLVESSEQSWFRLDGNFDFLSFGEEIVVLDRKHFEAGLNLKHGMITKAEVPLAHFEKQNFFVDPQLLRTLCTGNMRYLRRLCTVHKRGYYLQVDFLQRLAVVAKSEGWEDVVFVEGRIQLDDKNIAAVLTVLADQRLKSPTTNNTYDADASHQLDRMASTTKVGSEMAGGRQGS